MQRDGGYLQALDRIGFPVEVSSSRTRHGETPADRLWNGLQPRARVPLDHPPPAPFRWAILCLYGTPVPWQRAPHPCSKIGMCSPSRKGGCELKSDTEQFV